MSPPRPSVARPNWLTATSFRAGPSATCDPAPTRSLSGRRNVVGSHCYRRGSPRLSHPDRVESERARPQRRDLPRSVRGCHAAGCQPGHDRSGAKDHWEGLFRRDRRCAGRRRVQRRRPGSARLGASGAGAAPGCDTVDAAGPQPSVACPCSHPRDTGARPLPRLPAPPLLPPPHPCPLPRGRRCPHPRKPHRERHFRQVARARRFLRAARAHRYPRVHRARRFPR